jgi:hypothetical protein
MLLGWPDGREEGWEDGSADNVGESLGCEDGLLDGISDGMDEGWIDGWELGIVEMLGCADGDGRSGTCIRARNGEPSPSFAEYQHLDMIQSTM